MHKTIKNLELLPEAYVRHLQKQLANIIIYYSTIAITSISTNASLGSFPA
jgi:hypothetical protein